ncbi:MAG: hypothetical protein IPJ88_13220 [Myxococcales bacterium]|nr:MAG: hypothetical protein IPJ88_13220 [Myxococcales bacterium]
MVHSSVQKNRTGVVNYNVFACSNADYERICALQREHFEQIRAIVAQSAAPQTVAVLQNNVIPLSSLNRSKT